MGLFEADTDADALLDYLGNGWKATFANAPFPNYKLEILEDKDWERQWMDRFEPLKFGSRLWVCPSWKPVPVKRQPLENVPLHGTDVTRPPGRQLCTKLLNHSIAALHPRKLTVYLRSRPMNYA